MGHTMTSWKTSSSVIALTALVLMNSSCTSTQMVDEPASLTCDELLTSAVDSYRSDGTDLDYILDSLSGRCSNEYEIAVDYISNAGERPYRIESCADLIEYGTRRESITLLEQDGACSFVTAEETVAPEWPEEGLGWDSARDHVGSVQRVCGPLASMRQTDDGTFVNVGRDYPSAERFTFIFWDYFLDPIEAGATICGSGEIYLYEGVVAQMEMWDPAALEIWR